MTFLVVMWGWKELLWVLTCPQVSPSVPRKSVSFGSESSGYSKTLHTTKTLLKKVGRKSKPTSGRAQISFRECPVPGLTSEWSRLTRASRGTPCFKRSSRLKVSFLSPCLPFLPEVSAKTLREVLSFARGKRRADLPTRPAFLRRAVGWWRTSTG